MKFKSVNGWDGVPLDINPFVGFVYEIIEKDTGKSYIGIKTYWKIEKKKPPKYLRDKNNKIIKWKKGKLNGQKKLNTRTNKIYTKKESDWKTYNTSSLIMQQKLENNPENYEKIIIRNCKSITELKAWEAHYQLDYYLAGNWDKLYNQMINLRLRIRKNEEELKWE